MRFTLHYRGPLKSNADARAKHRMRTEFHQQLSDLWSRAPLKRHQEWLSWDRYRERESEPHRICALKERGGLRYSSVVHEQGRMVADLDILILRPGGPGDVVKDGGDIDNRLKTLFDALTIPDENQARALPRPEDMTSVQHCVFEDDRLITGFRVSTDRLLNYKSEKEVLLIVHVDVSGTDALLANLDLIG